MLCRIILGAGLCATLLTIAGCQTPAVTVTEAPHTGQVEAVPTEPPRTAANTEAGISQPAKTETVQTAKDTPVAAADACDVIVSLGDLKLTMQQIAYKIPNAQDEHIVRFAKWWLENELLYMEAERRGLTSEPIPKFYSEIMRKSAFVEEIVKRLQDAAQVTDEDVQSYYDKNKETDPRLSRPGSLSFLHVRTKLFDDANAVLARIKAGEDIRELARKLSIYPDSVRGGEVRNLTTSAVKNRFGDKFMEVMTRAADGEIVGPVEADGGYEVALKTGEVKSTPQPLDAVKDSIRMRLSRTKKEESLNSLLDSLKQQAAEKIVKSPRLIEAELAVRQKREPAAPETP